MLDVKKTLKDAEAKMQSTADHLEETLLTSAQVVQQ